MISKRKKFAAILFDFDGVIGKTMDDNYISWKHAFSKYGIHIDKNEFFLLEGMTTDKIAEHFLKKASGKINISGEVAKTKDEYYLRNRSFSVYNGIGNLLPYLKEKGYLLALVSGGTHKRISKSLKNKFLNYFDVVITGDDITRCKPHPEPYLTAAKKLSVKPSDCLAIENAPLGIESAKRAGMQCIAVCSTLNKKYLTKADKLINRITELSKIL